MLSEGSLDLQLLLDGSIGQLGSMALHLCCCAEGALQPPRLVLHLLQLTLQTVKLWLTLHPETHPFATFCPQGFARVSSFDLTEGTQGSQD